MICLFYKTFNIFICFVYISTLKLDLSPDIPQAVPGDTLVGAEVLASNLINVEDHLLSVAVLINVLYSKPATRVDWHLPVLCSKLDPVVDRPRGGLNFAFQSGAAPGYCTHQVLPRM